MRKLLLMFVVLAASLLVVSFAIMSFASNDFETLTINGTAQGFTASKITTTSGNMHKALCTLEGAQIRYRTDGTAPTGTVGHILDISGTLSLNGYGDILNFSAISTTATSGTLRCTYWK